jgi:glucose/arabinose dehydrogenase
VCIDTSRFYLDGFLYRLTYSESMRRLLTPVVAVLAAAAFAAPGSAALRLAPVASGFNQPVHLASTPSEPKRVYVVQQGGLVKIIQSGRVVSKPFLDLRSRVVCCGEQGLLSMAFHPSYPSVRRVYVNFTNNSGDTRVIEYRVNSTRTRALTSTARVLLSIYQPYDNHNGGQLLFGLDGKLYVPTGDGGDAGDPGNRAQRMNTRLGKLLRVDVKTKAVSIVALGLRNPWRVTLDRTTGRFWIGDVGQGRREEVDIWRPGTISLENYGWRRYEGTLVYNGSTSLYSPSNYVPPVHQYTTHDSGGCAITGGFVYRGSNLPRQRGRYFFGDYCNGRVWSFRLEGGRRAGFREHDRLHVPGNLSSFGEGPTRELYFVAHSGRIYRLAKAQ